jgi:hypothetical protein
MGSKRNSAVASIQFEITVESQQHLDKIIAIFSFAPM